MANLDYELHKDNGEVIVEKGHVCFAKCLDPIAGRIKELEFKGIAPGSTNDKWKPHALKDGRVHFTHIVAKIPCKIHSDAWLDFLFNLPCYKDKASVKYINEVNVDDKHSPFTNCRHFSLDYIAATKRLHIGYYEVTVSLATLPVQFTFSLLSMIRYCRDYPEIVHTFDHLVERGLHPYLSFVLAQQVTGCGLNDWRSLDFTKPLSLTNPTGGGAGHHSLTSNSANSISLVDMLYREDYSGAVEGTDLRPYSKALNIKNSWIRFNSPDDGRKLEKQLRLVEDGVFTQNTNQSVYPYYGRMDLSKLRIKDLNDAIEKIISGEVSTEIFVPNALGKVAKKAKKFLFKELKKSALPTTKLRSKPNLKHTKELNDDTIRANEANLSNGRQFVLQAVQGLRRNRHGFQSYRTTH